MALVGSPLSLACCSSSSAARLGNASPSPAGVLGSASWSELLPAAMSVLPVYHRPSSLLCRVAAARKEAEERFGGISRRRNQLGRWSTGIQSWNVLEKERRGKKSGTGIYANYGIKEYGTPKPPYDAPSQVKTSPKAKPSSSGQGEVPQFWDYGSPSALRPYTSPNSYGAPQNYGIPAYSAETARVSAVEAVEPPQGLVVEVINAEPRELEPELGGGDGGLGKDGGRGGGGGGGDGSGEGEESEPKKPMSTSQKLTLVYAALVGVGGVVGFAKSGSNKSLMTGGGAALVLFLVFTQLPTHPTFASSVGLGISAVLLGVMYPRFKQSGKFMPAGLVALVSLIMTGGYLHGIVRTAH
ncbi:unnamed protein product [Calypogeia fissa]